MVALTKTVIPVLESVGGGDRGKIRNAWDELTYWLDEWFWFGLSVGVAVIVLVLVTYSPTKAEAQGSHGPYCDTAYECRSLANQDEALRLLREQNRLLEQIAKQR